MNPPPIRVATRASPLAMAQASAVADGLRALGARVEIVPMHSEGDRLLDARLADLGGKGLFVREIEDALDDGRADAAVHSLKDMPAEQPPGLELVSFPEREDPRDVLVTRSGGGLDALPPGAVVGTSSLRRVAILRSLRPDLATEAIRGNVDTRLTKLGEGRCDALILAAAGLRRLGLAPAHAVSLAADVFVPAVGQGILGIEVRRDDSRVRAIVGRLDHGPTRACALAERAYLRRLGASCNTPMAGHARLLGGRIVMAAVVASEDGARVLRAEAAGAPEQAEALGHGLAESLLARGAAAVTALDPGRWSS